MSSGTVYLLHFDEPIRYAQHYLGWTKKDDAIDRVQQHLDGTGSRLVAAAVARGIHIEHIRSWTGDRTLERKLKNRKNAKGICPLCYRERNERARISMAKTRARRKREKKTCQ